ncbi:MAG: Nif3-like dinuclear metal center hexameric protein [Schwartzia sp.]|nr:Nif3-like dinuclear metal center hexameric protein [Schwartzia sp. (in: firmicutes)]
MVKCQVVMDAMERLAPKKLAEDWDNPGLLVGSPSQEVNKVLVCLDVRDEVIDRAVEGGYDMIVSHHPLIFRSMKKIRTDLPDGRKLARLLKHDIAVFAAHTNLDIARGGVNDVLAERCGLGELQPFDTTGEEKLVKLAVYVPRDYADAVRDAIFSAGAGHIGNYSECSFNVDGKGTFKPLEGTHPFIGTEGTREAVDEVRIETIFPSMLKGKVVRELVKAHPYEEPAYDLYPLANKGAVYSLGRIGSVEAPVTLDVFAARVKEGLGADSIRVVRAGERLIKKAALCSGSGAEFIEKAAFMGCDVYITGDVRYHDAQRAVELGIHVIDAGHFPTEQPVVPVVAGYLRDELGKVRGGKDVEVTADDMLKDFFSFM